MYIYMCFFDWSILIQSFLEHWKEGSLVPNEANTHTSPVIACWTNGAVVLWVWGVLHKSSAGGIMILVSDPSCHVVNFVFGWWSLDYASGSDNCCYRKSKVGLSSLTSNRTAVCLAFWRGPPCNRLKFITRPKLLVYIVMKHVLSRPPNPLAHWVEPLTFH